MKKLVVSRGSSAARRAMPRYVAALGAWALLTVSVSAADFTWKYGPGVDVSNLAYGDGIDENPGNAFYDGSMYFFENRYAASAHVWKGTNMDTLAYQYQAVCDKTFPVYVGDQGCWFAGLWIDPATGDFYSTVHHEFNKLNTPGFVESRRVGIAKSTDQGRHWTYLGDCLSSPNDDMKGPEYWKGDAVDAGCGDQHLFVDTKSGYFYLYYVNKYFLKSRSSNEHKMKVARCKISDLMAPGKWFKFYNGAWTEPGLGGKGTWLDKLQGFPDVKYSTYLGKYIAICGVIQTCASMETQDWTNYEYLGDISPMTWGYPLLTDDANQADNGQVDQTMRFYLGSCAPAKCYYWPVTLGAGTSEKRLDKEYRGLIKTENMYFEPNPMLNWNYPGRIAYESKSLNYVGTWTNSFHYDDDSGGTKYSETAGDSVELSFPGDSVNVRVRKASDAGKCDIYLDDLAVPVATGVDTYCASNSHAQSIFAKNGLAQGNHVVKLVIKGAHQASSSGNRIYLDTITFTKATPAYDCPDLPTGVSAKMHSNSVALAWNSVTGASSYNVYRTTHASGVSNLGMIKKGAVGTSYIDSRAADRAEYYYRVTAVDADGKESLRSAVVVVTVALFRRGFETNQPLPVITSKPVILSNVEGAACQVVAGVGREGSAGLVLSGTGTGANACHAYFAIFETAVSVEPDSILRYWLKPENELGRCTGIDLLFQDGSTLRDSAAHDLDGLGAHPSQPKGQVGQWKQIKIPIGQWLAGKVVRQVVLAFDQPGVKGAFNAVVDDVSIGQE